MGMLIVDDDVLQNMPASPGESSPNTNPKAAVHLHKMLKLSVAGSVCSVEDCCYMYTPGQRLYRDD
mgnify:CR=1 FL=1